MDVDLPDGSSTNPDGKTTDLTSTQPPKKSFFSRFKKSKEESDVVEEEKPAKVSFGQLFRFSNSTEKVMMAIGSLCAIGHGALLPIFTIVFGDTLNAFSSTQGPNPTVSQSELVSTIGGIAKWFLIMAGIAWVCSFFQVRFMMIASQRIGTRIRRVYFRSLMQQEPGWYDSENTGELTTRVASDVDLIQAGIGDKVGSALQFTSSFVIGFVIAFVYAWKLTLVILAVTPLLAISGAIFAKMMSDSVEEGQGSYGSAGAIAFEALSLIRTGAAFGGQKEEIKRYEKELDSAYKAGVRKSFAQGLGMGITFLLIFCVYSLAFWYGDKLIREQEIGISNLFVSFFSVMIGAMGLGQAAPSFSAFAVAQGAAPRVYQVIDRESKINPLTDEGDMLNSVSGELSFEHVTFNYESRAAEGGEPVLKQLNLRVSPGTTHALVGPSGCGKSSTMGLMMRFYDPDVGKVVLDGCDLRSLNVRFVRSLIGYVGQMPTLFRSTIRENIALGAAVKVNKDGSTSIQVDDIAMFDRDEVTEEQIIEAAKLANAHDFISRLPDGYNTMLGDRGALLSGGQKQRICIARAIVRNPKILLLDEATSALDAQSERVVQDALERAAEGRTTVVIAHRLSTIRNADTISVFKDGEVVESGNHDDLMKRDGGAYRELVELQNIEQTKEKEEGNTTDPESSVFLPIEHKTSLTKSAHYSLDGAKSAAKSGSIVVEGEDDELPPVDKGIYIRALKLNRKEWVYILLGVIGAGISGASWPISALAFSESTASLGVPGKLDDVRFWSLMYVVVGIATLIGNLLQFGMLGVSGEKLTRQMRGAAFRAMLKQEMGYFDEKDSSVGALTYRLSTEASLIKGITGDTLGAASLAFFCVAVGIGVAFSGCWQLALVVLALLPFMAFAAGYQQKMMSGFDSSSKKDFAAAGSVAAETIDNVRTVTGLGVQDEFMKRYKEQLEPPLVKGRKAATLSGIMFGFSEFFMFAMWAIAFWVGAKFIELGLCDFPGLMKAVTGLLFAGFSLGNVSMFAPDVAATNVALTNIFRLFDRDSKIDPSKEGGMTLQSVKGSIKVKGAKFEYPTRPNVAVLRGMDFAAQPGQVVALVGHSGCGKSTIVALLERFYDVRAGSVKFEGVELRDLDLQNARSHMALVQQEPDLYNRSIRDNISYGLGHDEGTPITDKQIEDAARAANAHDFIMELPEGYDTIVGERGSGLSGGQRQRVAIARALIRQPKLLLLDEATSALDARSERVVQEALDAASKGRTTIIIAHRLSTVKNADVICFVKRGKIAEMGTHDELMARGGGYSELVKNQMTTTD